MEVFIIHLAKSSAILLVAYWVYLLLVRFTTFHHLNRSYLLLSVCLSLLIPFIHFPVEESHVVYTYTLPTIELAAAPVIANADTGFHLNYALWYLYVLICLGLAFRLVYYINELVKMLYKHPKKRMGKFTLIRSSTSDQAFSFFRYIVVPKHLNQRDEQIIIEHEMLHALKWHSVDVLFMEVVKVIFWFHPAIYLLKRELIQQHEFEIDRLLTNQTIDIEQYGNLLIQQAQYIPVQLSLTNNFNHSLIKNRIKMLTKSKSKNIQLLRYAILLLFMGTICTLMAFEKQPNQLALLEVLQVEVLESKSSNLLKTIQYEQALTSPKAAKTKTIHSIPKQSYLAKVDSNQTNVKKNDNSIHSIVEEMPKFPGGDEALFKHFASNLKLPEAAKEADIQGVVVLGFTIEKDGSITDLKVIRDIGGGCGEEAIRVANLMPKWLPGMQDGQTVRVGYKLPVRFKLDGDQTYAKDNAASNPPNFSDERKEALKKLFETGVKKVTFEEENPDILTNAEVMPEFPGGDEALLAYFGSKIIYPEAAKNDSIQGLVVLDFIVEKDGSLSNFKILRNIGSGCGEEAVRVAKLMPNWSPARQDGQTVKVSFTLPVRFKLDREDSNSDE